MHGQILSEFLGDDPELVISEIEPSIDKLPLGLEFEKILMINNLLLLLGLPINFILGRRVVHTYE